MRITNNMTVRNYTKTLNTNLGRLNRYSQQIITGRRFDSMDEDPASGVRAMQVRRSLAKIDGWMDNAKTAKSKLMAAETNLLKISSITSEIAGDFVYAINGTMGEGEREILADKLETLQQEIISLANGQFSDRYLFGGTNTQHTPFVYDADANILYYNGVDVSTISAGHDLLKDTAYIDIGIGMNFEGTSGDQEVNPLSAFNNSYVGLEFIGFGDRNLITQIGEMVNALRDPDFAVNRDPSLQEDYVDKLLNDFRDLAANVTLKVTKLGADDSFLDFTIDRLETERLNLYERQDQIEMREPTEAIMDLEMQKYVYYAALQLGQSLLQPTLFDFIK